MQIIRESCRRASTDGLTPTFIRHLAGNHTGYEALLLPLLSSTAPQRELHLGECEQEDFMPRAELLFKQCQVALTAPKVCQLLALSSFCMSAGKDSDVRLVLWPLQYPAPSCSESFLAGQCKGLCTFLEHLTLHSRVLPISEHICTAEHPLVCSVQQGNSHQ